MREAAWPRAGHALGGTAAGWGRPPTRRVLLLGTTMEGVVNAVVGGVYSWAPFDEAMRQTRQVAAVLTPRATPGRVVQGWGVWGDEGTAGLRTV